jgi:hypothetical protein
MGPSTAPARTEPSRTRADRVPADGPELGHATTDVRPDIRAAGNLAVQRLRRSGLTVAVPERPATHGAGAPSLRPTAVAAPAAAQGSVLDDVVQGATDLVRSVEETAADIVRTGEEAVEELVDLGRAAVAAVTTPGGVVIPIPDIPLFDQACLTFPWAGSTGNLPFYDEVIDVPYVGPVTITLYVRGDALASLVACVGPVTLRNIRVVIDPLASRYSGTAQLFAPAGLTGSMAVVGSIGGVADWLGLVELAAVEGSLVASGTGVATAAFIATAEVVYDSGDVTLSLGTELDTCLSLTLGLDALARASLLSTPVWSGAWRIFGWTWQRCWRLGASLSIGLVGGAPTVSVDLSAEALPVGELLPQLLATSGLTSTLTPTVPVPVVILGNGELWWFDNERPPAYPVDQALLATAGGLPGTFRWEIVSGVTFADFAGFPTAVGPSALLTSKSPSRGVDDVDVRVTFHGAAGETGSATLRATVRAPQSMTHLGDTPSSTPAPPANWQTLVSYSIQDQFGTTLPRNVPLHEFWFDKPPIPDFAGTNWPSFPPAEGSATVNPAGWNDQLGITDGVPPVLVPTPLAPGAGGPLIQHFSGGWRVGSLTPGRGRIALLNTWRFFQDHGDHLR